MDKPDEYPEVEIARRRDAAIKRALNTPPIRQKDLVGKPSKARGKPTHKPKK